MTATLLLPGSYSKKITSSDLALFFSNLKIKHRLNSINTSDSSLELIGSPKSIMTAISVIAYNDIFMINYKAIKHNSDSSHTFSLDTIRREIRRAKSERFSCCLIDNRLPACYGNMPWLFITPKTNKAHEEDLICRMNKCLKCPHQQLCGVMSLIRVLKENKLNGN